MCIRDSLDESGSLQGAPGRVALAVPAVLETDRAVHDQAAAGLDQVKGKSQVLDDVEPLAKVHRDEGVRLPADGGEVEPVAPHQADCEWLTAEQSAALNPWGVEAFRPVDQAHDGLVAVSYTHLTLPTIL